jgi:signal transduction histidine kinase/DNA-binding response OmpR family regulator
MTAILVAEDSPTQAESLAAALEGEHFSVAIASDGEAALALVRERAFDLVISDVVMPGISGYELCRSIKAGEGGHNLPVILVTSLNDPMDVIRGLECGADSFLRKPYDPADLISRIQRILDNRRMRRGSHVSLGIELAFLGKKFLINSEKEQILDLLISTFEDIIRANRELQQSKVSLAAANAQVQRYARELEERVRARTAALAASERRFQDIAEVSGDWLWDTDGEHRFIGLAGERAGGPIDLAAIVGRTRWEISGADPDKDRAWAEHKADLDAHRPFRSFRHAIKSPSGKHLHIVASGMPVFDAAGQFLGYRGTATDETPMIEAARRAETAYAALAASEARLDRAQAIAGIGSWELELVTGRMIWSPEMYRLRGLPQGGPPPTQADLPNFVDGEDLPRVRAWTELLASGGRPPAIEFGLARPDGEMRRVIFEGTELRDERGRIIGTAGTLRDVTEQRLTEHQLVQAQKMEAIGTLTGGLAHDFNNLLGVVIGNIDLLRELAADRPEFEELAKDALDAALRGADLTRRLLAFARRQPLSPTRVAANELIANITKLLNRSLGEQVEIRLDLAPDLWPTNVDPAQLEAAIANLATNARDAMPKGGRLTVATRNVHLDGDYVSAHMEAAPGDYIVIEVSDTGSGIPPEIVGRIFEPFFTTKEQGKGTGLGLSMVFGFIRQSGGHINVYSEPGEGTTFRLYLPRDLRDAAAPAARPAAASAKGGGERILLVEDDAKLSEIVAKQLASLGYGIVTAGNASAAKALIERGETVDLLLTDIVMPGGRSGIDLAYEVSKHHPSLKIVLTSGFPDARFNDNPTTALPWRLLSKPYRKEDLARAVRDALDGLAARPLPAE